MENFKLRKRRKIRQWDCLQVNVDHVNNELEFDSSIAVSVQSLGSKAEARAMNAMVIVKTAHTRATRTIGINTKDNDLLIFNAVPNIQPEKDDDVTLFEASLNHKLSRILKHGITDIHTGYHYMICAQSASQARGGKYWAYKAESWKEAVQFIVRCTMLDKKEFVNAFGDMVKMPQFCSRVGLAFSTTHSTEEYISEEDIPELADFNSNINVKVIEDVYNEITTDVIVPVFDKGSKVKTRLIKDKKIKINVSDGNGYISILTNAKLSCIMGKITLKEFRVFKNGYTTMGALKNDEKLRKIFDKMPIVWQIRHAGDKGILIVDPLIDKTGYDIIMHKSMHKYTSGNWSGLELCAWGKDHKSQVQMNYQFVQQLHTPIEELLEIAKRNISVVKDDILVNPASALEFYGAISKVGELEEDEEVNKVVQILKANKNMIEDKKVQQSILHSVDKYVSEIGIGKLTVSGSYYYILNDPRYTLYQALKEDEELCIHVNKIPRHLQKGEFYLNNHTEMVAGFRAPLIDESEINKMQLVEDEDLWYLKDILILNPYDDTQPRAGGADQDGDKFLVTDEPAIVNGCPTGLPMLYDEGLSCGKVGLNVENLIKHFLTTAKRSRVGEITNYATVWNDNVKRTGLTQFNKYIHQLRFCQGLEIDKAKTGIGAEGPEGDYYSDGLKLKEQPEWMQCRKGGEFNQRKSYTYCPEKISPMQALFNYVKEERKKLQEMVGKAENKCSMLLSALNSEEVTFAESIMPDVTLLERNYRKEMMFLLQLEQSKSINKEQAKDLRVAVGEKYNEILLSLANKTTNESIDTDSAIAYACYYVAYTKEGSNSISFPWTCMFDSMIQLLYKVDQSYRLYRLPDGIIDTVSVNETGEMFINDMLYKKKVVIPEGEYQITVINEKNYILAKNTVKPATQTKRVAQLQYLIEANGFKHYNLNCMDFLHMVEGNNNTFEIKYDNSQNVRLFVGEVIVGNFKASLHANELVGYKVRMVSYDYPLYIPKRVNNLTCWHDKEKGLAYKGQLSLNIEVIEKLDCPAYQEEGDFNEESFSSYVENCSSFDYDAYGNVTETGLDIEPDYGL